MLLILIMSFTFLDRISPFFLQRSVTITGSSLRTWWRSCPGPALSMLRTVLDAPQRLLKKGRESRKLVLLVVFVALLLDNMLLTVVGTFGGLGAGG